MARAAERGAVVRAASTSLATRWIRCGLIDVWPSRRLVRVRDRDGQKGDAIVSLTPAQCAILMALVDAGGEPVSRAELSRVARRRGAARIGSRVVDAQVYCLRQRLGDPADRPRIIVTIPTVGYALDM